MVLNQLLDEQRRRFGFSRRRGGRTLDEILPPSVGFISTLSPLSRDPIEILDRDIPRVLEYQRRWRYYEGNQYTPEALRRRQEEAGRRAGRDDNAQLGGLYTFVRSFYNIVPRVVDANVDTVFRDPVQFQPRTPRGATEDDSGAAQEQIDRLVRVSGLELERYNIVRYASVCGDVYLRVGVDAASGLATVFVHSPEIVRVQRNPFDKRVIEYAVMSYQYEDPRDHVLHMRTDVFWPDRTVTFRDGEQFDFDGQGSEQENRLGIVPIVHVKNLDIDLPYGVPSYGSAMPTMDVVNEVLSFLVNILKLNADPVVLAYGIAKGGLQKGHATDMNATTVWYVPNAAGGDAGARVEMLEWKGNLPDMIGMLKEVRRDIEDTLPELHLSTIKEAGAASGFALNSMMFPFIEKTTQLRTIHRHGLGQAMAMARALQDILDGSASAYDPMDPRWDVDIKLPPVLPLDEDAELNRAIALLDAGLIGPREALRRTGVPDDQVDGILEEATQHATDVQAAQQRIQDQIAARSKEQVRPTPTQRGRAGVNGQPVNNQLNSKTAEGS